MKTIVKNKELIACFLERSLTIEYDFTINEKYYDNDILYENFKNNPYTSLFYFGFENKSENMSLSLSFVHLICYKFIKSISYDTFIEFTRTASPIEEEEIQDILNSVPFALGAEYINSNWVKDIWDNLSKAFKFEIEKYEGSVDEFLKEHSPNINVMGRVCFHLVESKHEDYPFAFLATYSTSSKNKKENHVPLKHALIEYKDKNDLLLRLLSTVSKASERSDFISELVENGELFSPLKFSSKEAYIFLKEIPLYEESGILCRMPNWWKKNSNSAKLSIAVGDKAPSKIGMDAILKFKPEIYLSGEKITKEELEELLSLTNGLSFIKGKWVEVDHDKLTAILNAYEKAEELSNLGNLTLADAMRMELNPNEILGINGNEVDMGITNGQWLQSIRNRLSNFKEIGNISLQKDFKAHLRNYQEVGFNWLYTMKNLGFGALLADDMGLGKTVQILALLEYLRENGSFKALLVIPASLIGNWENEIAKFAPKIKYSVLHSKNKTISDEANLFITTYGMATRIEELKEHNWDLIIIDEAQAIKNPSTKQTKAIKAINGSFKIAMTGTPIENRLSDLWSLFDFLNKGLLGTSKEFSLLSKDLLESENYSRLKDVVNPFIMRRLKTDKAIISDLPDKIEIKSYTTLTKKQIVLYKALVNEIKDKLQQAEGIERKGLVLASIMKFKQICNHPDQYLGLSEFKYEYSGKFDKLSEICETIYEKHERVLVFTQFREMTQPIADYLETIFNQKGLILHGGTEVKKRSEIVDRFNKDEYVPFMVLSLKAGGVGLNLTAANHVIHFDRWWNPAVENQATDRAFRIGQKKNVMVHKMITTGTIEEKIDSMIEDKLKLSGDIIASTGENWITEMSNDELIDLFKLV